MDMPQRARHADATSYAPESARRKAKHASTYLNASGVLILSEADADAIRGVEDPFVRFLLVEKTNRGVGRSS